MFQGVEGANKGPPAFETFALWSFQPRVDSEEKITLPREITQLDAIIYRYHSTGIIDLTNVIPVIKINYAQHVIRTLRPDSNKNISVLLLLHSAFKKVKSQSVRSIETDTI